MFDNRKLKWIKLSIALLMYYSYVNAGFATEVKSARVALPGHANETTIRYILDRGTVIFQGDIDLGPEASLIRRPVKAGFTTPTLPRKSPSIDKDGYRLSVINGFDYLWPSGKVPFSIDAAVPQPLRNNITAAISHWNANTNLSFNNRTNEKDYVYFVLDNKMLPTGSSPIGRQGSRQTIKLQGNAPIPAIAHEIGHSIGLWHEQARGDRDEHIRILWANIIKDTEFNFDKHLEDGIDYGPYDINSLMHYESTTLGRIDPTTGKLLTTIQSVPPGRTVGPVLTGGRILSNLDIQGVNALYPDDCRDAPALYEHPNATGARLALTHDAPKLKNKQFNDKASSICVPTGWTVRLYEHEEYNNEQRGKQITLEGPQVNSGGLAYIYDFNQNNGPARGWNEKVSSVRVAGRGANLAPAECANHPLIFEHDHYQGRRAVIKNHVAHLKDVGLDDVITSICVPKNWTVKLYQDPGFKGEPIVLRGPLNIADILRDHPNGEKWDNKVTSIEVFTASSTLPAVCSLYPVIYQHDNFRGESMELRSDVESFHTHKLGDTASSICVPEGWTVTLYEDKLLKGRQLVVRGRLRTTYIRDLKRERPDGRDWGDKVSSAKVIRPSSAPPPVSCMNPELFEHDNFRGKVFTIGRTLTDLHPFGAGDNASSLCVPAGFKIVIYEHKNRGGRKREINGPAYIPNLHTFYDNNWHWGDKISSVDVFRPAANPTFTACTTHPLLYHDPYFSGKQVTVKADIRDLHANGDGDRFSSICVPAGKTLRLYEHANYGGKKLTIAGPMEIFVLKNHRVNGITWDDTISSVKLIP